ncbi:similar to Saccharomyces cerevisiae YPR019W MCM4 Essential helicase component of heterohexameric MCM2-7 complexes which bind pre- replication complexes on DNA and melt DNA prior to replication [Maudiozyma barnettii]|uniref:DNA replication licensing factor MCM4 n=1 Tax=Maudiozyma barnettii TaxID=61262 RepID=A0A8H2VBX4_9SACH|nr:MCM DNA helicase complex subunit MCM4 [Kazachstania barnettii]CAB4252436.1 similar to Saccharomyces cerevisiae YPR019W MCM4 Essential helicase component of heterohexameric MCM2-7 complexes which bind pre- replication complexes on DNA and melt DNA prior to replication [Kazachstania barnettii]CAD1779171.1 similar to Saccharomyces cerevisiae YPR019W MCM4 Essential helicase component of heterohexameric MCM2-7 complexes which bind pre- replication complexes on DNA and melt DNA prior to replication 
MSDQPSSPAPSSPGPTPTQPDSAPPNQSSPARLFYNSSSSQGDTYDTNSAARRVGSSQNNRFGSSPFNYPSSSQNHSSDINGSSARPNLHSAATPSANRFSSIRSEASANGSNSSSSFRRRRNDVQGSDFSSPRRFFSGAPNSQQHSSSSDAPSEANEPVRIIWGTNVSIQECANNFRNFLMSFKYKYRKTLDEREAFIDTTTDEELYYVNHLNEMRELGTTNLNLDARNLLAYKPTEELYYQLLNYPQEVISIMDQTIKDCMVSLVVDNHLDFNLDDIETKFYKVRPYNVESARGMRELNPNDIDKLISLKGLILRTTPVIPDMKVAFFKCNVCDHTMAVEIDRGVIQEPARCERIDCNEPNSMSLIHNRCSFADKQVIKLQETPDLVPDGQTPHSVSLCVYDELVDSCRAGDRIEVTGTFRSIPIRANSKQRILKALYKTYIDVVHVKKVSDKRLDVDTSTVEQELLQNKLNHGEVELTRNVTDSDIAKIHEVAKREDLYNLLSRSISPSIFELDDVKKGILLQLFGGTNKHFNKGGRYRGDINILLCGDPSTAKSQILQYVHKIAPRGVYTSGKGSSAVGLTAYITRDVDTNQLVLESGALVLSDGGICCIDEFDKMSDSTRSVLHEVMEQQTISVAKAGIITTLNARTSILASANPIGSRYNPNLPVTENIDLPPPLLSRFDLVYLVLDKVDESNDRELANHLTALYLEDKPQHVSQDDILPVEFLTMYINYAKEHIHPVITNTAKTELVRAYVGMRKMGDDSRSDEKRITATTRQLESMIRLSEAHAKMRLSETVELEDVHEAVRLIKTAIKDYATDPKTGKIDMNLVQTGKSVIQRKLQEDLTREIVKILTEHTSDSMSFNELNKQINEHSQDRVDSSDISDVLARLIQEDKIIVLGEGVRRSIRLNRRV